MIGRIIYIGLNKLKRDIWARIFICVQLVLIIYLFNLTIGMWRHETYILNMVNTMNLKNAYYCSNDFESFDSTNTVSIGEITQAFGKLKNQNKTTLKIKVYDEEITKNITLPLSKGIWFEEYNGKELPIILSNSYAKKYNLDINDTIELELQYSTEDINVQESFDVECKVIGTLNKANYHLTFSSMGNYLIWKNLFKQDESVALIGSSSISAEPLSGKMVFLKNLDDDSTVLLDKLGKLSSITSSQQITKNSKEVMSDKLKTQIIMWFLILALTLASLTSNNMLEKIYEEKEFAAYYMLGLDWSKCVLIEIFRGVIQILFSFVIAFILLKLLHGDSNYKTLIIDGYSYLLSIIMVFCVYMISSLWMIIELLRTNPIVLIRRNE